MEARGRSLIDKLCQLVYLYEKKLLAHHAYFMSLIFRAGRNISGLGKVEVTPI